MFWRMMKLGGWEGGLSKLKKEAVDAVEPQYLSLWASSVFRVSFTLHLARNPLHPSTTDTKYVGKITNPNVWAKNILLCHFHSSISCEAIFHRIRESKTKVYDNPMTAELHKKCRISSIQIVFIFGHMIRIIPVSINLVWEKMEELISQPFLLALRKI